MLPEQQQRILGYFIEEAKDHLITIEQGLLNLQDTLKDSEMVNEIFRAAHSVKGGAAMLGLNSIQRTAHRLEDFFKVLKECPQVQVDQQLESLFLRVFDTLRSLLEQLESASLTEDVASSLMSEVEPHFAALEQHLGGLVNKYGGSMQLEESAPVASIPPKTAPATTFLPAFQSNVMQQLRQMLQLFKQPETSQTRQQLQECCDQLVQVGEQDDLSGWCTLCETVAGAIADQKNTYRTLAPIIIKELKQAQELVLAGRAAEIKTCEQLQTLAVATFLFDWEEDTSTSAFQQQDNQVTEVSAADTLSLGSEQSDLLNFATDEETVELGDDIFSSPSLDDDETSVFDSLFGEPSESEQSLRSETSEFSDWFDTSEIANNASSNLEADLSNFWQEEPETETGIEFELEEFSLDPNEYEKDSRTEATASSSEILGGLDDPWDEQTQLNLNPESEDWFLNDLSELLGETAVNIPATDIPALFSSDEFDLTIDTIETDLFSLGGESESNLDLLFDEQADVPVTEIAVEPIAAFDLNDLEAELDQLSAGETSNTEADAAADVLDNLEAETDFAELEALLAFDELASPVLDTNTPTVPTTQAADESVAQDFSLEKQTEVKDSGTVKPTQPPTAATNNRRPAFEQMMRVPIKQLDNIGNLVGELVVYRNSLEQDQEKQRQFLDNLLNQVQKLSDVGVKMQELYERSLLEASLLSSRNGFQSRTADTSNHALNDHATGMDFDALEMDRFTAFHTLAQETIELIVRVRESSSDIEFVNDETENVARQFRQVTTQLQEGLTRSRMVPFGQIAERLPRAVRDISLKYGKQAELNIEGRDTLIDKGILEQLYDPMTHLVNNAITHGIEFPEDRVAKGKPPIGQITVRAFHQGNQTVITVADDGAGIDAEKVKAKAIQKKLITPELAQTMSRLDVYNLLFNAGFSTKDSVDEFAGRGVGMDVVLTSLNQIRGIINTDSNLGKGTTFTIRLPLTLSICKALCCVSDKARIAFPMDSVEQTFDILAENVTIHEAGQTCIPWRDSLLPFRHLKELITYNRQLSRGNVYGGNREDNAISIVVLRSADTYIALQVDQVLGEQEIVIKQFEAPVPKPVGIAGATVMGDGRIMPIADVLELIDLSTGRLRQADVWEHSISQMPPQMSAAVKTEPMVLIVDDSITVRELLSMTFANAGYRVEQARDGQEAWDKLRDGLPCELVFCDIEMPRMDGLELLSRMQKDPNLCELPIAMLTSRGSNRHRQMAVQLGASGYFTKPYLEEALLDAAQRILRGEVLVTSSGNA